MTELKQKPVTVKVWKLTRDNVAKGIPEWVTFDVLKKYDAPDSFSRMDFVMVLNTKLGHVYAQEGKYVVLLADGYLQAWPEELLQLLYEPTEG